MARPPLPDLARKTREVAPAGRGLPALRRSKGPPCAVHFYRCAASKITIIGHRSVRARPCALKLAEPARSAVHRPYRFRRLSGVERFDSLISKIAAPDIHRADNELEANHRSA